MEKVYVVCLSLRARKNENLIVGHINAKHARKPLVFWDIGQRRFRYSILEKSDTASLVVT